MSYTAPQYVDTKEQAILALASTIKGEAVTGGDGSVNRVLDILADVLAEQDVQVPQTDAGAILALADYVSGGGGGSSDFTTATVNIVNTLEYPVGGTMAMTASAEGNYYSDASFYVPEGGTSTFSAILYRGHCLALFNSGGTRTIDGSATVIADDVFDIYGDCTITSS